MEEEGQSIQVFLQVHSGSEKAENEDTDMKCEDASRTQQLALKSVQEFEEQLQRKVRHGWQSL